MLELTKIVLRRTCPYCHAWAGDWCHSPKSGKRARYLHSARGEQVYAAWRIGFQEGRFDMASMLAEDLHLTGKGDDLLKRSEVVRWLQENATANQNS